MFGKNSKFQKIQECSYDLVSQISVQRDYYHGFSCQTLVDDLLENYTFEEIKCVVAASIHSRIGQKNRAIANDYWAEQICKEAKLPEAFKPLSSLDNGTIDVLSSFVRNCEEVERSEYLPDDEAHVLIVH